MLETIKYYNVNVVILYILEWKKLTASIKTGKTLFEFSVKKFSILRIVDIFVSLKYQKLLSIF